MEITYESICKKLGFHPLVDKLTYGSGEDDSEPSRFSVLSLEEHLFLMDYINSHENKN